MRKYNNTLRILFSMLLSFIMIQTQAQTGLNFQGVARNSNNVILASQPITIRLSILQGSATGTADYTETRKVTTNAQGLFTAIIGDTGTISSLGSFATINWKLSPKFLKIEMDPAAGSNFITMGTTQFQYVAYAQFAKTVDAENIVGIVPVTLGGTGVNSLTGLKSALAIDLMNNTSDANKPISTATQTALDLKLDATGNAATASRLATSRNINGVPFDGSADITILSSADAGTLSGTSLKSTITGSSLTSVGTIISGVWSGTALAIENGGTGATSKNFVDLTTTQIIGGTKIFTNNISANSLSLGIPTTGIQNTMFGYAPFVNGTPGNNNTAIGFATLQSLNGGDDNTAVGANAIRQGTPTDSSSGSRNTALGSAALSNGSSASDNTAFGYNTLNRTTGGNNTAVGSGGLSANTYGTHNTASGYRAIYSNTTGSNNTANGSNSLYSNTTGSSNTVVGAYALNLNSTGDYNTANGYGALNRNSTGSSNTANGSSTLFSNTTGNYNTAVGFSSLFSNTTGFNNTASGLNALFYNTTGFNNTANGLNALYYNNTGHSNTADGYSSLLVNTTGSRNVGIGNHTLNRNTTGSYNTAIGFYSGEDLIDGSNNTFLGHNAKPSSSSVSDEITLGNASVTVLRSNATVITALSDRRDKTNIIPIVEGLAFLKKLNPVSFTWNTRDKAKVGIKSAGFIAQDLLELQKQSKIGDNLDLVSENNPEKLEARYGNLLPIVVKSIQELSAEKDKEISDLKLKLINQEDRIKLLETLVNKLTEIRK